MGLINRTFYNSILWNDYIHPIDYYFEYNGIINKIRKYSTQHMKFPHMINILKDINEFEIIDFNYGPRDIQDTVISFFMTDIEIIKQLKENTPYYLFEELKLIEFSDNYPYKNNISPDIVVFTKCKEGFWKNTTRNFEYRFNFLKYFNKTSEFHNSKLLTEFYFLYYFYDFSEFEKAKFDLVQNKINENSEICYDFSTLKRITKSDFIITVEEMRSLKNGMDSILYSSPLGLYKKHVYFIKTPFFKWVEEIKNLD